MAGSVPARDGGAIGIRRQAKPRRTLTGHSDQPDMRLLDKEIDDWQAVHSGGSLRGALLGLDADGDCRILREP
jgi:hypothetical protein